MTDRHTWMKGLAYGVLSEQVLQSCAEGGLQCVEFHDCDDFSAAPTWSKNTGIKIWSRHLKFGHDNIGHRTQQRVEETVVNYKRYIDEAALTGAEAVVIHPSGEPIEDEIRPECMARSIDSFNIMVEHAKQYHITVCCENLPRTCLCRNSDECLHFMEQVPGLKLCFDTNHLLSQPHNEFIRMAGKGFFTTHVSDYDFVDEKHWFPFQGDIDWKELVAELEAVDYQGPFLFETGLPDGRTTRDVTETINQIFSL